MPDRCFLDTNVLVYAHDPGSGEKHKRSKAIVERLWHEGSGVLSTQVLQEFYVNVRRKAKIPIPAEEAAQIVRDYLTWEVVVNSGESILGALQIESRFKISFWDALIIQAANSVGVSTLYSEDLNPNQVYGLVRVVNPFL